ncbi:MAG: ubiquinone biosynthesis protein UbiH [Betaproteobacteria bacterium]|nr:ubiquinone biosynthesis protein UbiH [Betaproteobacteria bacterium]
MSAANQFEIAIAGGALVGAALARALAADRHSTRVALISQERPATQPTAAGFDAGVNAGFDARVYAISPANAAFLAQLGAWSAIPEARRTPVHAMRVYGDDGASLIEFDAYRTGCSELAWIVEDRWLRDALWCGLENQKGLSLFSDATLQALEMSGARAGLTLKDGRTLSAQLVVGADGARSLVRAQAGIAVEARGYGQSAVVANFACERPHRNVAFQWFQGANKSGAVLALLPLPGDHVSMVWSTEDAEAARLLALAPTALAQEVALASHASMGALTLVTPARAFPLQQLTAGRLVAPRVALAGDAAHVIHPLAGQGANLGLQDVRVLAQVLGRREPGRDPGDLRLLHRYARARAEDILAMRYTVHGLFRLFEARGTSIARLRNAGLNFAERMPVLKNLLMRHAMG